MRKSKFNLTHLHSTTLDMGYLVPICLLDCLPNDSFRISLSSFIRAQPMLSPLMHEVFLYTQYWFVPYRLLWDNWEAFITGGNDGLETPPFPIVKAPENGFQTGSLADYFGFPISQGGIEVSAMPFRAMAEIWNTRYRDEDLQSEIPISYADGLDDDTSVSLLSPAWRKDYFTTARGSTQRGAEISVPVSVGGSGAKTHLKYSIRIDFVATGLSNINGRDWYYFSKNGSAENPTTQGYQGENAWREIARRKILEKINDLTTIASAHLPADTDVLPWSYTFTSADLATITFNDFVVYESSNKTGSWKWTDVTTSFGLSSVKITYIAKSVQESAQTAVQIINLGSVLGNWASYNVGAEIKAPAVSGQVGSLDIRDLRVASALQRYQERSLKYGNRYEEFIQREFGIKPRDSRIQRPEYLGGSKSVLQISEVLQTAEGTDTGVGTMRGHGVAGMKQRPIRFTCPEHGLILGLLSIRPAPVYTQGIDRAWLKRTKLDFFVPELANVGMQEVFTQEVFATKDNKNMIFGYQDRYNEYRSMRPRVTGEFRTTQLSYWNIARHFDQAPHLNDNFINMAFSTQTFKRPFAVQNAHAFLAMIRNNIRAYRPIPKVAKNILK